MKGFLKKGLIIHRLLYLLTNLLPFIWAFSSFGQGPNQGQGTLIEPLAPRSIAYQQDKPDFKPMHHLTSKSVVLLEPSTGGIGTGFFIKTDPDKPYYCLLTAGHNFIPAPSSPPQSIDDQNAMLTLSYRIIYAPRNDGTVAGRTKWISGDGTGTTHGFRLRTPVTIVKAENSKDVDVVTDRKDYALVKVPIVYLPYGVPIAQNNIGYVDPSQSFPTNLLRANIYTTPYLLHHGDAHPQTFSPIRSDVLPNPTSTNTDLPNFLAINAFDRPLVQGQSVFTFALPGGSSGAPLVMPQPGNYFDAPAVGISIGDKGGRQLFFSLQKMKDLIEEHCSKGEDVQDASIARTIAKEIGKGAVLKGVTILIDKLSDLYNQRNADLFTNYPESHKNDIVNATDNYKINAEHCKSILEDEASTDDQIKEAVIDLEAYRITLTQKLRTAYNTREALIGNGMIYEYIESAMSCMGASVATMNSDVLGLLGHDQTVAESQLGAITASSVTAESCTNSLAYSIHSPDLTLNLYMNELTAIQDRINSTAGLSITARAKRDEEEVTQEMRDSESKEMSVPRELKALQTAIWSASMEMNSFYNNLKAYKSPNVFYFMGVEYFYKSLVDNQDRNSNRYFSSQYYEDQIRLAESVIAALGEERVLIDNNNNIVNYASVVAQLDADLNSINQKLDILRGQHYPKGFVTITNTMPLLDLEYRNFTNATISRKLTWTASQGLLWRDLGLGYGPVVNDFKPIPGTQYVKKTDLKGEMTPGSPLSRNDRQFGAWYTTKFRIKGTLPFSKLTFSYHPDFRDYLDRNEVANHSGRGRFTPPDGSITYVGIWDATQLPDEYSEITRTDFVKDVTSEISGSFNALNTFEENQATFQVDTPETLIIGRKWTMQYNNNIPVTKMTDEINFNPDIAKNIKSIRNLLSQSPAFSLQYRVSITSDIYWDYNIVVALPPLSQANARESSPVLQTEPSINSDFPVLFPNPVKDQVQVMLPIGYEKSVFTLTDVSGKNLGMPIPSQGYERQINVGHLPTGLYFIQVQTEGKPLQVLKFLKQ